MKCSSVAGADCCQDIYRRAAAARPARPRKPATAVRSAPDPLLVEDGVVDPPLPEEVLAEPDELDIVDMPDICGEMSHVFFCWLHNE